jgi:hypothetical protein
MSKRGPAPAAGGPACKKARPADSTAAAAAAAVAVAAPGSSPADAPYTRHIRAQVAAAERLLCRVHDLHDLADGTDDLLQEWAESADDMERDPRAESVAVRRAGLAAYPEGPGEEDAHGRARIRTNVLGDVLRLMDARGSVYVVIANRLCGLSGFCQEGDELRGLAQAEIDNAVAAYARMRQSCGCTAASAASTFDFDPAELKRRIRTQIDFKNLLDCYAPEAGLTPDGCIAALQAMDAGARAAFVGPLNAWPGRVHIFDRGDIAALRGFNDRIKAELAILLPGDAGDSGESDGNTADLLAFICASVRARRVLNLLCALACDDDDDADDCGSGDGDARDPLDEHTRYVNVWQQLRAALLAEKGRP